MRPRYFYEARLFPANRPFLLRVKGEGRKRVKVDDCCFALARRRPFDVGIWIEHDEQTVAGTLTNLIVHRGWYLASFTLDPEQVSAETEERLRVGTPLSVGFDIEHSGLDETTGVEIVRQAALREVSIVRKAAVEGARITDKRQLQRTEPSPAAVATSDVAAGEVPVASGLVTRYFATTITVR